MAAIEELHPDDRPPDPGARRGIPRGLLWALALAVVVLTVASWVALSNERTTDDGQRVVKIDPDAPTPKLGEDAELVGRDAPGFALTRLGGGNLVLNDLRGKPVLINFWASTCTPCIEEMPALEQVHQRYGDKVTFVGVASMDRGESFARAMVDRTGVTYDSGYDGAGNVLVSYGTTALPATYLLDADGIVRYQRTSGAVAIDELTAALDRVIG